MFLFGRPVALVLLGHVLALRTVLGQVTVHGQKPLAQTATDSDVAQPTLAAYDPLRLTPPAVPQPPPASEYTLSLPREAAAVTGLSIPHVGPSFWGFSIEMSVLNQVLGRNSTHIQVPFLNLMANLVERSGGIYVRIGGNTQEFATMVPFGYLPQGQTFGKEDSGSTQTTRTPAVVYTIDMFYLASNISSLVGVKWFLGIPFNDSVNWRLTIAEEGETILRDNLLGLQAGNEPDFYEEFGRRESYSPAQYSDEVQQLIDVIATNDRIPTKNNLLGPSVATGPWTPEMVWETNFIERFRDYLYALTVEHYPTNNCAAQFNTGNRVINPQDIFQDFLTHQAAINLAALYINSARLAVEANKPLIMFETNTASCGGFAGISDSYGASLWAMDYGFQLAYTNFTHALLHVGGQKTFYNPFTAPPTNQSSFNEWSVGAVYYSAIVLAEAFGKSNTSRIVDTFGNGGNLLTPSYAIYENDVLSKVALFNYVDDPTGVSASRVTLTVPGAPVPGSVRVKYLLSHSVSDRDNITWAGQTLGTHFHADGRFKGDLQVETIECDTVNNACVIPVPAPGFALVFFDQADELLSLGQATQTFATTARTKGHNTATIASAVLATSNGHSGLDRLGLGSTSQGSVHSASERTMILSSAIVAGAGMLLAGWAMFRSFI